jgi:hypothetical protein
VKHRGCGHGVQHGFRCGVTGGPFCTPKGAFWSTPISVIKVWSKWEKTVVGVDSHRQTGYSPVRSAVWSHPSIVFSMMSHQSYCKLVVLAVVLTGLAPAIGDDTKPPSPSAFRTGYDPGDDEPSRCWWMPNSDCRTNKCAMPYGFATYQSDVEAPAPTRTLIEEVDVLLDTPRYDAPALSAGKLFGTDGPNPVIKPSGDQFSRAWTDGAPLLLFDWSGKSGDSFAPSNLRQDGLQRVASANSATDFGDLSAKVKLRERDAILDPGVHNTWETDQTVKVPVAGSMFFFNQVSGSTPDVDQQQYKWLNKAGVGLKLKPWLLEEVQLRTGPAVRYDDTGTLTKGQSPERSELFLEAVTKLPLPLVGPINVEYSSYAVPAANSSDHTNQINQDFKLALPIGGGQFHVGAKYKWESASATPWMDRMEVYLGVQNKW